MKTEITNLLTGEKTLFVNDLSLTDNIVNHIICNSKRTGQLLNKKYREEIKAKNPIVESISTVTGRTFAFCENKDLHAKYII
jgi:hypothetical protein